MNRALQLIKPAQELVRIDPWTVENQVCLALAYFCCHQFGDAAEAYARALTIREDPAVHINMGTAYAEMGDLAQAKLHYGLVLLQNPFAVQAQESLRMLERSATGKEYPRAMHESMVPLAIKRP